SRIGVLHRNQISADQGVSLRRMLRYPVRNPGFAASLPPDHAGPVATRRRPVPRAPPAARRLPAPVPHHSDARCPAADPERSEEHTSELQSRENLVCRLLLEKKKKKKN